MMTIVTGLEERQEHERPEQLHEQHLDDDSDGRDHAEERHGPAVQLRKEGTVPLHETAPPEVVALPGLWLPRGPRSLSSCGPLAHKRRSHSRRANNVKGATE